MMILIDLDRLAVYEQILLIPDDPCIKNCIGNHRTQSGKPSGTLALDLKSKFMRHLMHRQLDMSGDL